MKLRNVDRPPTPHLPEVLHISLQPPSSTIRFTQMLVLTIFASAKRFGLVDVRQRGDGREYKQEERAPLSCHISWHQYS